MADESETKKRGVGRPKGPQVWLPPGAPKGLHPPRRGWRRPKYKKVIPKKTPLQLLQAELVRKHNAKLAALESLVRRGKTPTLNHLLKGWTYSDIYRASGGYIKIGTISAILMGRQVATLAQGCCIARILGIHPEKLQATLSVHIAQRHGLHSRGVWPRHPDMLKGDPPPASAGMVPIQVTTRKEPATGSERMTLARVLGVEEVKVERVSRTEAWPLPDGVRRID